MVCGREGGEGGQKGVELRGRPCSLWGSGVSLLCRLGLEWGRVGSQQEQTGLCRSVLMCTGQCTLGSACGASTRLSVPEAVSVHIACKPCSLRPGRLCEETSRGLKSSWPRVTLSVPDPVCAVSRDSVGSARAPPRPSCWKWAVVRLVDPTRGGCGLLRGCPRPPFSRGRHRDVFPSAPRSCCLNGRTPMLRAPCDAGQRAPLMQTPRFPENAGAPWLGPAGPVVGAFVW